MVEKQIFDISEDSVPHNNLTGKFKNKWVEESFVFEKNIGKQTASTSTRNYLGKSINEDKLRWLIIIIVLGLIIILGKIFYIQVINGAEYRVLAEGNRIRLRPIPSERGIIFDRNGKQLVQNIPSFSLAIIPQDFPNDTEKRQIIISKIAAISSVPEEDIKKILEKYHNYSYESIVIKENLDYETALKLYIQNADLPGVLVESGNKRDYIYTHSDNSTSTVSSLSHILGYLAKIDEKELANLQNQGYLLSDNIGKTAIEKVYETDLRGQYGKKKIEVNALGKEQNVIAEEPPLPGKNLFLTIDLEAQRELENLIKKKSEQIGKKRIAAVAMNPQNGEILAMVSWPSFDNNLFSGGIKTDEYQKLINNPDKPLFNRVIGGTYPSGSVAKFVVAAAALQEGIITAETSVLSVGGIYVGKWFFKDWKVGGHGRTNVFSAIASSVNTFFYYIGGGYKDFEGLGIERLTKYMRIFNLGEKTGIDLPGEDTGFVPSPDWKKQTKNEIWYIGDTYNLSIGQGDLLVTPLQVAEWTAAIANDGNLVTPHLNYQIEDPIKNINTTVNLPFKKTGIVSAETANTIRKAAQSCVTNGSCRLLTTLPFTSGGKTGTAQWSSTKDTHAWFTAFAPYENPKIVITVLIEEGGEGGIVSIPIARDWLMWWGKKYLTQ